MAYILTNHKLLRALLITLISLFIQSCAMYTYTLPKVDEKIGEMGLVVLQVKAGNRFGFGSHGVDWNTARVGFNDSAILVSMIDPKNQMIVKKLKPGTYKVTSILGTNTYYGGSTTWRYNPDLEFTVAAGKVTGIGLIRPLYYSYEDGPVTRNKVFTYRFNNLPAVKQAIKNYFPKLANNLNDNDYIMSKGRYDDETLEQLQESAIRDAAAISSGKKKQSPFQVTPVSNHNLFLGQLGTAASIVDRKIKLHKTNTTDNLTIISKGNQKPLVLSDYGELFEFSDDQNKLIPIDKPEGFSDSFVIRFEKSGILLINSAKIAIRKSQNDKWEIIKNLHSGRKRPFKENFSYNRKVTEDADFIYYKDYSFTYSEYVGFNKKTYEIKPITFPIAKSRDTKFFAIGGKHLLFSPWYSKHSKRTLYIKDSFDGEWRESETPFNNESCYFREKFPKNEHQVVAYCSSKKEKKKKVYISSDAGISWY